MWNKDGHRVKKQKKREKNRPHEPGTSISRGCRGDCFDCCGEIGFEVPYFSGAFRDYVNIDCPFFEVYFYCESCYKKLPNNFRKTKRV